MHCVNAGFLKGAAFDGRLGHDSTGRGRERGVGEDAATAGGCGGHEVQLAQGLRAAGRRERVVTLTMEINSTHWIFTHSYYEENKIFVTITN